LTPSPAVWYRPLAVQQNAPFFGESVLDAASFTTFVWWYGLMAEEARPAV
jgi:hypothetical protein